MFQINGLDSDGDDDLNPNFDPDDYEDQAPPANEIADAHRREIKRDEKAAALR